MSGKSALIGLAILCITILIFTLMVRGSLCELRVQQGSTVMQATLAYEVRK